MIRTKKIKRISFSFNNYFRLIFWSLFKMNSYVDLILGFKTNLKFALSFLILNLSIWLLGLIVLKIVAARSINVFFAALSEVLFTGVFIFIFLVILAFILSILAKILRGGASLKMGFQTALLCSIPIIFLWVPYLSGLILIWACVLLVKGFYKKQGYSLAMSVINILLPVLGVVLVLFMFGFSNFFSWMSLIIK